MARRKANDLENQMSLMDMMASESPEYTEEGPEELLDPGEDTGDSEGQTDKPFKLVANNITKAKASISTQALSVVKAIYADTVETNWEELFDGFDRLYAITFSSGIEFVNKVNCRAAMGAGLARQIRDKWPVVFDEYVKVCNPKKLGDFQVVRVAPQLYVANLFGQSSFGRDKRQTNYAALGTALFRVMKEHTDATFRVPYGLGCGLAGGNWVTVLNLIEEAANAWNVNVEIWVLPQK